MRNPFDTRTRCLSSVQRVRTISDQGSALRRVGPLPAPVLLDESSWRFSDPVPRSGSLGRADSPCFRAHRQYLRHRFGALEIASGSGRRIVVGQRVCLVSPLVPLVCVLSPRARVNLVTAERQAKNPLSFVQKHQKSAQSGACVTSNTVDSLPARLHVGASQTLKSTLKNGAAERDIILKALPELPDPGVRWPGSPTQPAVRRSESDRRRHRRSGVAPSRKLRVFEKQIITPLHAPNHLQFLALPQHNFPQNWSTRFLSSATWQSGRRRCTT